MLSDQMPDRDTLIAHYAPDRSRPWLRINFVTSPDGAATIDGKSAGLGSDVDKTLFGLLRTFSDAVMVGAGTARHEGYGPIKLSAEAKAWRDSAGLDAYPRMVLVSGRLDLDPAAALFSQARTRPIVITHGASHDEKRDALAEVADVLVHGVDRVDILAAVAELRERYGLGQILCEGGPHLFGSLLAAGVLDELCLTVSPILVGPSGPRIVAGTSTTPLNMTLASAINAGGVLLLRYAR
jgi:riboflavin biosynthesis pyrimidine reductase